MRSAWSSLTIEPLSSAAKGMLLFGCDRILDSRQAQVALKNAKQRIARRYLAALQILEDCGQCSRLCLGIDGLSQVLILRKFCLPLLLNRFELRLQDSQCFKFMHDGYRAPPPGSTLLNYCGILLENVGSLAGMGGPWGVLVTTTLRRSHTLKAGAKRIVRLASRLAEPPGKIAPYAQLV